MTARDSDYAALDPRARTAEILSPVAARPFEDLDASTAIAAMKRGDVGAEEYARRLLDRAEALRDLNAFITLRRDDVLEGARAADAQRASGADLGPLHGLPIPIKDSVNAAKYPTSNGTAALRDFIPKSNAPVVDCLLAAGGILMGKTNLHELSLGWTSINDEFGAVLNPYDRTRIPGGSSGGSAAAVAARIAPVAVAEDTLGSIRIPSSMCGVCGLRPTYGRYPNDGMMPLTDRKFDQVGMVARTVEDLALFDSVLTGDWASLPSIDLRDLRIGIPAFLWGNLAPDVERVATDAIDRLEDAGVTIVRCDLPDDAKSSLDVALTILGTELGPTVAEFLAAEEAGVSIEQVVSGVGPNVRAVFASPMPPRAVYEAMIVQREKTRDAMRGFFADQRLDAMAFPPSMIPPHRLDEDGSLSISGEVLPGTTTMGRNMAPSSVASLASLVLPAGLTSGGLPIGIELDALPGTDRRLLAIGAALYKALGAIAPPRL